MSSQYNEKSGRDQLCEEGFNGMKWTESYAVVIITFKIIEILIRKDPWRSSAPTSH